MSSQRGGGTAKRACSHCRRHKRKCDKALPKCSICIRRRDVCNYENTALSDPGPTILSGVGALTPLQIKADIIRKLFGIEPKDVASAYFRTIESWFPVISESKLCSRLPSTWDNATVGFTLLSLTIILLCTVPEFESGSHNSPSDFMSLYLCTKSWIALVEGLGVSSLDIVHSRVLMTLLEVSHGFYPAAYVSIGSAVRAAEALVIYRGSDMLPFESPTEEEKREERVTWCGILILDRYIAIENGKFPPATRGRTVPELPYSELPYSVCSAISSPPFSPRRQFLRLFEATNLLDKVHTALHEPILQHSFNIEEVSLIVKTLSSLETVLQQEVPEKSKVYASALAICITGLLLSYENGCKAYPIDNKTTDCRSTAVASLDALIEAICKMIEQFSEPKDVIDINPPPPFTIYLVYKAASVVTESLRLMDNSRKRLQRLKSLRGFLKLMSKRWLAAGRYLNLLNEDTTLRILKAVGEEGREMYK